VYVYKGLLPAPLLRVIGALAALSKYCYFGEIPVEDLEWYRNSIHTASLKVQEAVNNLPDEDRNIMVGKVKFHLLMHLKECILRFGPPCFVHTEKEESYNKKVRIVNKLSNRKTYSYNSAKRFSEFQCLKAILTGGFFQSTGGGWFTCSDSVKRLGSFLMKEHFKAVRQIRRSNSARIYGERICFENGYSAGIGSFVEYMIGAEKRIMRINEVIRNEGMLSGSECDVLENATDEFGNFIYIVRSDCVRAAVTDVVSVINMQHYCDANCKIGNSRTNVERSQIEVKVFKHSNNSHFVFNSFCFSR
jgi:hypothetical protein